MYLEFVLLITAIIIYRLLEAFILTIIAGEVSRSVVYMIMQFIIPSITGFLANYLYLHKATRMVEKAKRKYSEPGKQIKYLRRKGRPNIVLFIILFAAILSLFI